MSLKVGKDDAIEGFKLGKFLSASVLLEYFDEEYQKGYISELVRLHYDPNLDKYLENIQSLLERYRYNPIAKEILTKTLDNF